MNKFTRVLITGSQGYVGTELYKRMKILDMNVVGLDIGFFHDSNLDRPNEDSYIKADLRDLKSIELKKYDMIIHLAALSNDPLGEINSGLTYAINRDCAVSLAKKAKNQGVQRFIFASTQSIYGVSNSNLELEESAEKNPITAYAKSKWEAEEAILALSTDEFSTVAVRPSTIFGWGSRIRTDIIFNNMIASGLKCGKIEVHTDGSPYRPVIHISDAVDFFILLLSVPSHIIQGQAYNLGYINGNYSVLEVAQSASKCLGGLPITLNTENLSDQRSYKVSFEKAKVQLNYIAKNNLEYGGEEIIRNFNQLTSSNKMKFFDDTNRLRSLRKLMNSKNIDSKLSWI